MIEMDSKVWDVTGTPNSAQAKTAANPSSRDDAYDFRIEFRFWQCKRSLIGK